MNYLDIDIGNSRIKWRLREDMAVLSRGSQSHLVGGHVPLDVPWAHVHQVNIACVARPDLREKLIDEISSRTSASILVAKSTSKFGSVINSYSNPEMLGVDRWLAVIAAYKASGSACCIVDAGTAITIDFVANGGVHEGGYIVPGISLQRQALLRGTHAAKATKPYSNNLSLGTTTDECIDNGIMATLSYGIQSILLARGKSQPYQLFFTGGDAEVIRDNVSIESVLSPDLVLDGLALLAESQL